MKAKKGKMPAALAKYWRTHARPHKRGKRSSATRRVNPHTVSRDHTRGYVLIAVKGLRRLHYAGGPEFSNNKPAVIFPSVDSLKKTAIMMRKKFPVLKSWGMGAKPVKH